MPPKSKEMVKGKCQICHESAARYRCPRCGVCTCSLLCVVKHKKKSNCSGIRDRLKMVEKSEMDNFTLLSDYRFLEEIDHRIEDGMRNPVRKCLVRNDQFDLPPHLRMLKKEAIRRGTVLQLMPRHFTKHQQNSTRFHIKEQKIRWHIHWVFPHAEVSFFDANVDENDVIVDLLRKYLEPLDRLAGDEVDQQNRLTAEESQKLCYYHSASYSNIAVLLKADLCYYEDRFIEMFMSRSVKDNLANRKVVEYPVFYVVFKDHLQAFLEDGQCDDGADVIRNLLESSTPQRGGNYSKNPLPNRECSFFTEHFGDSD